MSDQFVTVTFRYAAETPEQAAAEVREIEDRYEGPSIVTAASSLAQLPRASEIPGAEEALGR